MSLPALYGNDIDWYGPLMVAAFTCYKCYENVLVGNICELWYDHDMVQMKI